MNADEPDARPRLRVVRGEPSDDELAALTVLLAAVASAGSDEPDRTRPLSRWSDRRAGLRAPLHPGPGAWRAAGWPG